MTVSQYHEHKEACKRILAKATDKIKNDRKNHAAWKTPGAKSFHQYYDYGDTQEEDRIEVIKQTKDYQLRALLNPEEYRCIARTCYTKKKADTKSGETKVQHPPPEHEESKQRFGTAKKNAVQVEDKGTQTSSSSEVEQKCRFCSTNKLDLFKKNMEKDKTPNVKNIGINDWMKIYHRKLNWEKRMESQRRFIAEARMNLHEDMEN